VRPWSDQKVAGTSNQNTAFHKPNYHRKLAIPRSRHDKKPYTQNSQAPHPGTFSVSLGSFLLLFFNEFLVYQKQN
jgi:hypothetical protein